jgi:hypothetical protein
MAGLAGFEPTIKESESFALPLGHSPINISKKEIDLNYKV